MTSHTTQLIAVLLALAASAWAETPNRGPIGHWRFDEGRGESSADATAHDRPVNILNNGRGVTWVSGRSGHALQFTGGDPSQRHVAGCAAVGGFDPTVFEKGLTLQAWVKFTAIDRPQTYEILSNTVSDRGPGFRFNLSWLSLWLRSGEGGSGSTWGAQSSPADTRIEPGVWYHLAATYDGSIHRVYVDGALVGESDPGLTLTKGLDRISIGAYTGGAAYGLNGIIDEVKIYDYARSPRQIVEAAKLE